MIDSPLGVLLAMFQEDKYFWAILDESANVVECRFCGGKGGHPAGVHHLQYCVIELAAQMIQSDEALLARVRSSPPRHVYKGTAVLTVKRRNGKIDSR